MSEVVSIRPAVAQDEPAIARLIALYPDRLVQEEHPEVDRFFVAEAGDQVVACCALDVYSKRLAEIRSLAVDPEFARDGLGRKLVEACQERARELGVRQLLAVSSAVDFFEKAGFSTFRQERTALFFDVGSD